jgi:N-acetylglucosamine kinase-like BadF-type ATPase
VVNDAAIALVAGAPGRVGIVILAGTGSIAYGADRTGATVRSGGYGFLLADEGSGYWLGHQALRAAVRAADGRGPKSLLLDVVFEALEVKTVAELVPRVYEKGLPKHRIAALAGLVQKAADQGDAAAAALLDQAAHELALAAQAVARQLSFGDEPVPVVLAGGVFKACPSLVVPLGERLEIPRAVPSVLTREPAWGAVDLALDLLKGSASA